MPKRKRKPWSWFQAFQRTLLAGFWPEQAWESGRGKLPGWFYGHTMKRKRVLRLLLISQSSAALLCANRETQPWCFWGDSSARVPSISAPSSGHPHLVGQQCVERRKSGIFSWKPLLDSKAFSVPLTSVNIILFLTPRRASESTVLSCGCE